MKLNLKDIGIDLEEKKKEANTKLSLSDIGIDLNNHVKSDTTLLSQSKVQGMIDAQRQKQNNINTALSNQYLNTQPIQNTNITQQVQQPADGDMTLPNGQVINVKELMSDPNNRVNQTLQPLDKSKLLTSKEVERDEIGKGLVNFGKDTVNVLANAGTGAAGFFVKGNEFADDIRNVVNQGNKIIEDKVNNIPVIGDIAERTKKANDFLKPIFNPTSTALNGVNEISNSFADFTKENNIVNKMENYEQENVEKSSNKVSKKVAQLAPSIGESTAALVTGEAINYAIGGTEISIPVLEKFANKLSSSGKVGKALSQAIPTSTSFGQIIGSSLFGLSAGRSYELEGKDRGMNDTQALVYGLGGAGIETASELISLAFLGGNNGLLSNAFKGELVKAGIEGVANIVENGVQEYLTEYAQEYIADMINGSGNFENIRERARQAGLDGMFQALIMGGASFGMSSCAGIADKIRQNKINEITEQEKAKAIEELTEGAKAIQNLGVDNIIDTASPEGVLAKQNFTNTLYKINQDTVNGINEIFANPNVQQALIEANNEVMEEQQLNAMKENAQNQQINADFDNYETIDNISNKNEKDLKIDNTQQKDIKLTNKQIDNLYESYGSDFEDNYSKAYITTMNVNDFIDLTSSKENLSKLENETSEFDLEKFKNSDNAMFLEYDIDDNKIVSHEGRHRAIAMRNAGIEKIPVVIKPNSEKGKSNRTKIDNLQVTGQQFENTKSDANVELNNLLPISKSYIEEIRNEYSSSNETLYAKKETPSIGVNTIKESTNNSKSISSNPYETKLAEQKAKYQEKLKEQKQKLLDEKYSQRYKSAEKKYTKEQKEHIDTITNIVSKWYKKLLANTESKHIPENMKKTLSMIASEIDMSKNNKISKKNYGLYQLTESLKKISNREDMLTNEEYEKLGLSKGLVIDEELVNLLDEVKDYRLNELNNTQLSNLEDALKGIQRQIVEANKTYLSNQKVEIEKLAKNNLKEIEYKKKTGAEFNNPIAKAYRRYFKEGASRPIHLLKHLGGKQFIEPVIDGINKQKTAVMDVEQFYKELKDTYKMNDVFKNDKENEFKLESGNTLKLSKKNVLDLYLISKDNDAMSGLLESGIQRKKTVSPILKKTQRYNIEKISENDLNNILSSLSENDKKFADEIGKYVNENEIRKDFVKAEIGMKGYSNLKNDFYWKIDRYNDDRADTNRDSKQRISRPGVLKDRIKNNRGIVVGEIDEKLIRIINEMAEASYVEPVVNSIRKTLNYRTEFNMKDEIINRFGKDNYNMLSKLLDDLRVGNTSNEEKGIADALVSAGQKNAVFFNVGTALKQATAISKLAGSDIKNIDVSNAIKDLSIPKVDKNENKIISNNILKALKEMKENSPIARWKAEGNSENDISRNILDKMRDGEAKALKQATNKFNEVGAWGMETSDILTWSLIWQSAKNSYARQNKLDVNKLSKKDLENVNNIFTNVIYDGQVVDDVFAKSHSIRHGNALEKSTILLFKNEAQSHISRINDGLYELEKEGSPKTLLAATKGLVVASALETAISLAVSSIRNFNPLSKEPEDDDETFFKKSLDFLSQTLLQIVSTIPIGETVAAKLQGFDNQNLVYSIVEDMWDNGEKILNGSEKTKYTKWNSFKKSLHNLFSLLGLPTKNIERDIVNPIVKTYFEVSKDYEGYYNWLKKNYNPKNSNNGSYNGIYSNLLTEAEKNNKEDFKNILKDLQDNYGWKDDKYKNIKKKRDKKEKETNLSKVHTNKK